jgi:hypothetical protein
MLRLPSETDDQDQNNISTCFEQVLSNTARFNQARQGFVDALMLNIEQLARVKHLLAMADERRRNRHLPG